MATWNMCSKCPKLVFICKYIIACLFYATLTVLDEWGLISGRGGNFCVNSNVLIESGPDPVSWPMHDGILFHF